MTGDPDVRRDRRDRTVLSVAYKILEDSGRNTVGSKKILYASNKVYMNFHLGGLQKKAKLILLVLLLIAGLGISIYAGSKVSNLFLNSAKASQCQAQKVKSIPGGSNSAVISWETTDKAQGKVVYGIDDSKYFSLAENETTDGKIHNLPLTTLTQNTKYYYVVVIKGNICDSSGQRCAKEDEVKNDPEKWKKKCIPYTFTTGQLSPQGEIVAPTLTATPVLTVSATVVKSASGSSTPKPKTSPSVALTRAPSPTIGLSAFCTDVWKNNGEATGSANWATVKQYDLNNDGVINGFDRITCQKSGR